MDYIDQEVDQELGISIELIAMPPISVHDPSLEGCTVEDD